MSGDWLLEMRVKENYFYTWIFLEGFKELGFELDLWVWQNY